MRTTPRISRYFHNEYTAAITTSVSTVLEIMPPTIGAAMRFITLAPASCPHKMGSSPAMMAVTVIILGAHALDGAVDDRVVQVATPVSAMKPIAPVTDQLLPNAEMKHTPPMAANGSDSTTISVSPTLRK